MLSKGNKIQYLTQNRFLSYRNDAKNLYLSIKTSDISHNECNTGLVGDIVHPSLFLKGGIGQDDHAVLLDQALT